MSNPAFGKPPTNPFVRFLQELDKWLSQVAESGETLDMYHLGRSSLIMHHNVDSATKDFDIVDLQTDLCNRAAMEFGKESKKAVALGIYLELVSPGLPPLPYAYKQRCTKVEGTWKVIQLWKLDDYDLAITKMKSFRSQDREDIQKMINMGLVSNADTLKSRLSEAFPFASQREEDDGTDEFYTAALANLGRVFQFMNGEVDTL